MCNKLNKESLINEKEVKDLIQSLVVEKERHLQEKLAKKISSIKNEETAEMVSELLYSEDGYIRNIAIEMLVALNESSLTILNKKVCDVDRNIRKFALDAIKYINGEQSCEIAMTALEDVDENVVEAALEVIRYQKYNRAEEKLIEVFKNTKSTWIINALLGNFSSIEAKHLTRTIEEKIMSLNTNDIEKNVIINTYVRTLGCIGSYRDIDTIINNYSKNFLIDDCNLIFGLSSLIIKEDLSKLTKETSVEIEKILIAHWNFRDTEVLQVAIAAFVKLQLDFFLSDIEKIYDINKGDERFAEKLFDLIVKLNYISNDFLYIWLDSKVPELVVLGLKLIYEKKIILNNTILEELCNAEDKEISEWAKRIVTDIKEYNNPLPIEHLNNCSKESCYAYIDSPLTSEHGEIGNLLINLENSSIKVRKKAVEDLILLGDRKDIELLEKIVSCNVGEEGLEALEVLFNFDANIGWNYISDRMDSTNECIRAKLIDIVKDSEEDGFYKFITTMINDPAPVVRKRAIKALNRRSNTRSLSLLLELYEAENNSMNKMEIISNLYRFNSDKTIDIIKDAAISEDTLIRLGTIKSLDYIKSSIAEVILKEMLSDEVDEVREAAGEALYKREVTK